nr:MAG: hypothetical protein [Apis mellifera filamentous virus]
MLTFIKKPKLSRANNIDQTDERENHYRDVDVNRLTVTSTNRPITRTDITETWKSIRQSTDSDIDVTDNTDRHRHSMVKPKTNRERTSRAKREHREQSESIARTSREHREHRENIAKASRQ